jgi:hypothetical protein
VTSDISQGSEGDDIITCMDAIIGFRDNLQTNIYEIIY